MHRSIGPLFRVVFRPATSNGWPSSWSCLRVAIAEGYEADLERAGPKDLVMIVDSSGKVRTSRSPLSMSVLVRLGDPKAKLERIKASTCTLAGELEGPVSISAEAFLDSRPQSFVQLFSA